MAFRQTQIGVSYPNVIVTTIVDRKITNDQIDGITLANINTSQVFDAIFQKIPMNQITSIICLSIYSGFETRGFRQKCVQKCRDNQIDLAFMEPKMTVPIMTL